MTKYPGHPLPWDELKHYEKEQGGYWLYTPETDIYGNGKVWFSVSPNGRSES
jgi:hypothetical protein